MNTSFWDTLSSSLRLSTKPGQVQLTVPTPASPNVLENHLQPDTYNLQRPLGACLVHEVTERNLPKAVCEVAIAVRW